MCKSPLRGSSLAPGHVDDALRQLLVLLLTQQVLQAQVGTDFMERNGHSLPGADTSSVEHNGLAVVQATHGGIAVRRDGRKLDLAGLEQAAQQPSQQPSAVGNLAL